jgi:hypothetical protein
MKTTKPTLCWVSATVLVWGIAAACWLLLPPLQKSASITAASGKTDKLGLQPPLQKSASITISGGRGGQTPGAPGDVGFRVGFTCPHCGAHNSTTVAGSINDALVVPCAACGRDYALGAAILQKLRRLK